LETVSFKVIAGNALEGAGGELSEGKGSNEGGKRGGNELGDSGVGLDFKVGGEREVVVIVGDVLEVVGGAGVVAAKGCPGAA